VFDALMANYKTGLNMLAASILEAGANLDSALELISSMQGRLILTGLGKSGHIAAKLAATFSSTGTPAYFLHPAEASHGDLGMVQPSDVILALSWSGETRELSDVIGYSKRRGVPLISLTSDRESTLAKASDVAIVLPKVREACPHNLAPTTSTMLQLVMGDALAIALLQKKGFSEESFHGFHPGGSLGSALKRVREIMHEADALPLIDGAAPVMAALAEVSRLGHGIVGVTEDGALTGVITDGDVRRYLEKNAATTMQAALHETAAREIMTAGSVTLGPDMMVGEAMRVLQSKRISAAFVTMDGRPVGLITMLRLLNRGAA
jgi:arabinose-5-phosphate isomerase